MTYWKLQNKFYDLLICFFTLFSGVDCKNLAFDLRHNHISILLHFNITPQLEALRTGIIMILNVKLSQPCFNFNLFSFK